MEGKRMIRELCTDEEVLGQRCRKATVEDAPLAQDLADTMASLDDCCCLAANQVGEPVSLFVWQDSKDQVHTVYNPRLLMGLRASRMLEGCVTREDPSKVTRYQKIKVSFDELADGQLIPRKRDYVDFDAQMIQHMIDHCQGKLV